MKKKQIDNKEELTKLDPSDYWEWRTTITEMQLATANQQTCEAMHKLLAREADVAHLRGQLFSHTSLDSSKVKSKEAKLEYDCFKKKLEEKYKISFNEKVIDDFTFEVKPLLAKE